VEKKESNDENGNWLQNIESQNLEETKYRRGKTSKIKNIEKKIECAKCRKENAEKQNIENVEY
jgi:hypothetical protein